ncbi:hypothetical protein H8E88_35110 [candidate division KSB1 bacterium]|nr:hypothetical protein [candidate division KSB1 bacterium]
MASILNKSGEKLLTNPKDYSGTVPVRSGAWVGRVSVKSTSKIISLILGIGIAFG